MISIIIPIYNQADKIGKCLASILNQIYREVEVIVVNDGSTDNIAAVLECWSKKFRQAGVKLEIIHQDNQGAPAARNRGLKEAQGIYLLFCDADITMEPEMLKTMLDTLYKYPDAAYTYSSFTLGLKTFKLWEFDAGKLKKMPYIHTTSLIQKECFPAGGFDETLKKFQDWDLWLTMLENGYQGVWIDKILYHITTGGVISTWLPSFVYKFLPFLPTVKKYREKMRVVKEKHGI
jgi:glycosyltransferase involved in cell wall biosynthesis